MMENGEEKEKNVQLGMEPHSSHVCAVEDRRVATSFGNREIWIRSWHHCRPHNLQRFFIYI
jgi:hypothetical protein